jgi:hypothetical protein
MSSALPSDIVRIECMLSVLLSEKRNERIVYKRSKNPLAVDARIDWMQGNGRRTTDETRLHPQWALGSFISDLIPTHIHRLKCLAVLDTNSNGLSSFRFATFTSPAVLLPSSRRGTST